MSDGDVDADRVVVLAEHWAERASPSATWTSERHVDVTEQ